MILYSAGTLKPESYELIANMAGANHFLFACGRPLGKSARKRKPNDAQKCAEYFCTQPQRRIFIDSGAFSAWTKGTKIDLDDYITFCKKIMDMAKLAKCPVVFAALDVISGKKEDAGLPTRGEIDRACDEGWANYQTMKEKGIEPCLMTFHQFDRKRWLTKIADASDYFAVAPRKAGVTNEEKLKWLEQEVFGYIQPLHTSNGAPTLSKKIHGLGVSSVDWMERFPFYSVDNRAWVFAPKAGYRHSVGEGRHRYMSLEQWVERDATELGVTGLATQLSMTYGMPTEYYLCKMLGYGWPGEKNSFHQKFYELRSGRVLMPTSGSYWLMGRSMLADVETEYRVTKHWRYKGLILPPDPSPLMTVAEEAAAMLGLTF